MARIGCMSLLGGLCSKCRYGDNWLLDDLKTASDDKDDLEEHQRSQPRVKGEGAMDFTYNLKDQLKVTINPETI